MKRTIIFAAAAALIITFCVATAEAQRGQAYVVQRGDTVNRIARDNYGKASLGRKLLTANRHYLANPNRLTPGDTLYLFSEETLNLNKPVQVPPVPQDKPTNLYQGNQLLNRSFPKYVSFAADTRGQGGGGASRVRIKRIDPQTQDVIDEYYEVREVGEIISSVDRGATVIDDGFSQTMPGRTLLSTGDQVVIRFTEDVAKILDSDTYEDPDPYFRTFPVYSIGSAIHGPDKNSADYGVPLGTLVQYKGNISIGARIEGLVPPSPSVSSSAKSGRHPHSDLDPVSYVASITYTEDPIRVADKVMIFVPLDPGPERRLDPPFVEPPNSFASPGK
ncbi:MAG: LysM peptidoglycan-binding domain-containing protein [Deltaproteobacteria bacterium]|jgi:hypothetical protein|nr:LysM peptidoglycan-binding domain-containing protein [Deltaproteobacteria bacterium]